MAKIGDLSLRLNIDTSKIGEAFRMMQEMAASAGITVQEAGRAISRAVQAEQSMQQFAESVPFNVEAIRNAHGDMGDSMAYLRMQQNPVVGTQHGHEIMTDTSEPTDALVDEHGHRWELGQIVTFQYEGQTEVRQGHICSMEDLSGEVVTVRSDGEDHDVHIEFDNLRLWRPSINPIVDDRKRKPRSMDL